MSYEETVEYIFNAAPAFQNVGAGAYKEGLDTTNALDEHFGHPHTRYRTIHVAGTNGKGSVSSTLAAILQSAGLRVGLYTSPHLVDFRERIRVNGKMIPRERIIDFVENERALFEPMSPSFFELATAMAFLWFAEQHVDVAVIEVGLGGRIDCTNIIHPDLSVITNISFDHQQFLGNTLTSIAAEKAGIIKPHTPVVIGETGGNADVRRVFTDAFTAANSVKGPKSNVVALSAIVARMSAAGSAVSSLAAKSGVASTVGIRFADEENLVTSAVPAPDGGLRLTLANGDALHFALGGIYQQHNAATILAAIDTLRRQPFYAHILDAHPSAVAEGFANVNRLTGLSGRWQRIHESPTAVCDAGHNVGGITYVAEQLAQQQCRHLHIVFGMVDDKDASGALALLPKDATFYFTQPATKRALSATALAQIGMAYGLKGSVYDSVPKAYAAALRAAAPDDFVFVGGSCYVVADLLAAI